MGSRRSLSQSRRGSFLFPKNGNIVQRSEFFATTRPDIHLGHSRRSRMRSRVPSNYPKVRPDLEEQPEEADRHTPEGGLQHVGGGGQSRGIEALIKLENWVTKVPV